MFLKKLINKGYEAEECQICHSPFKMITFDRIHKCKRCLKYVCASCGSHKEFVIDEEGARTIEKHRVCIKCRDDIRLINETLRKFDMGWQKDSILSRSWLQNLKQVKKKDYQYDHFLRLFHRSADKFTDETEIIDKDVIRGRTDFSVFNYSMKQFFYIIQQGVQDQHTTRLNIANVLYAIAARFDKVGYCQGMSGIAAFLLCFAREESSYIIFCDLLQNIFPPMFYQRSSSGVALIGLLAEIHFLKEYYEYYIKSIKNQLLAKQKPHEQTEEQINHIKIVIELAGSKSLLSIFIGVLNFTNLIFVWQQLQSKRNFQVIEKAFLAIIYLNRKNILEERSFKKLEHYFQNLNSESFQQTYHDIEIDPKIKKQILDQFYHQNTKKWNSAKNGNAYTLSKVTKLTEDEIKFLQKYFCPNYTNQQLISKVMINVEQFMKLIELYYRILKRQSQEGESILEISPFFLKKIFCSYISGNNQGLLFRQFVCCFSICTKSALQDRICSIITTFQDSHGEITYQNFCRLMVPLTQLAPKYISGKKICFMERMNKYFKATGKISLNELQILLNDEFINELTVFICSECNDIIELTLIEYEKDKKQSIIKTQN